MKFTKDYEIAGTAAQFWALYLDDEFIARHHTEAMNSTSVEVVSSSGSYPDKVERTLRYGQTPDMPAAAQKLFGKEIISTEAGVYDPDTGRWTFDITPGTMADKTKMRGEMWLTDNGDGTSTQTFSLEAKVKILGVGSMIEKVIESQVKNGQQSSVAYINAALADA